jgi:hypothetical protein
MCNTAKARRLAAYLPGLYCSDAIFVAKRTEVREMCGDTVDFSAPRKPQCEYYSATNGPELYVFLSTFPLFLIMLLASVNEYKYKV